MDSNFLLYILLYLNIISFILGYLLSNRKIDSVNAGIYNKNLQQKTIGTSSGISIQEDKYVVAIDTSNIEKKYENLGDVKKTTENISSSIDKLKNLKR